jgi:hypothetical protein
MRNAFTNALRTGLDSDTLFDRIVRKEIEIDREGLTAVR